MSKYESIFNLNKTLINAGSLLLTVIRAPLYFKERESRKGNLKIKSIAKSKKCYILGLGPSLKQVDFSKIDGDSIAVNHFYKFAKDINFHPTFYCMIDDAFFNNKIEGFRNAYNNYPNTTFLLNGKYKSLIEEEYGYLKNAYYSYMWKGYFNRNADIDYTKLTNIMGNVVCEAIALAIYAGYKEIILLGCDFNSFASQKSVHAYEEEDSERKISLGFELFCYSFVADTHYEIEGYAIQHGIKIKNATPGSLIDAYERVELKGIYK